MGSRLIFLHLEVCDGSRKLSVLIGLGWLVRDFQETAPAHRPYPKPTLVDW